MFDHCLYFNTTALARVLERQWTQAFLPFGLTPAQAFMLRAVLDKSGMLQGELASTLTITRATAARTLDGLQKLGLIERWSTERDGRECAIQPTKKALAMKDALNHASGEVTRRLQRELGAAQFEDTVGKVRTTRAALS